MDADGNVTLAVDFDALRNDLSDAIVDGARERYQFTWPGKREAKLEARRPTKKTMRPCPEKSKDWDTTENLYIEGDNLEALKIMRETYAGKVKLIYIDPPYNTGHDFVYDDDFSQTQAEYDAQSGDYNEEGGRLVSNLESNGRFHSDWCSMMYPRLMLARDLLSDDGAIFISIDDNEANNLEKICDEVFGRACFVTRFIWRKVDSPNDNHVVITPDHEYIFAYCKNAATVALRQREAPELIDAYNGPDETGRYWRDRLLRKNGKNSLRADRPTMFYPLTAPDGTEIWPIREDGREGRWAAGLSSVNAIAERGDLIWKQRDGAWVPYTREYAADNPTKPWMTIWNDLPAMRQTKAGMKELFGVSNIFDTPKPPALIQRCMELGGVENGDNVFDFFSGSAATAHAAMSLCSEKGVRTKWILAQIPETVREDADARQFGLETICDVGEERIRRAGEKIRAEVDKANEQHELGAEPKPVPDIGFRVLRVDESCLKDEYVTPEQYEQTELDLFTDNSAEDALPLDLLFQVLPAFRIEYSAKIVEREIGSKACFDVNDGQLIACFDEAVSTEALEAIAREKPIYAVFRDSSFASDADVANLDELFKTFSPETIRKVI
ncbi:site-specific DNA-methyltransferase [uncultured Parolsenella sp.]|uniref:site-specific DNA-methyltransferase n=1 Tax=uncultured Parolsenella sp. TaxID=2083008 RepID=UPI0025F2FC3C|nr:site-specific DNA-methyltransferase [uncultured Parolsenella sp.]